MSTLLVSDIHLGSHLSRAAALLAFLKKNLRRWRITRIILLGDVFSDLNFRRLSSDHFRLLNFLRKLSHPKRGVEVVWVEGNHDVGLVNVMTHLVGIKAYEEYRWEWNGRKCLAIHGHQFDGIVSGRKWLAKLIGLLYLEAQKIPAIRHHLLVWLDLTASKWSRLTDVVAERAIEYARHHGDNLVFCGHTHIPHSVDAGDVSYFNTGCWVGPTCTYIRLTEDAIEQGTLESPDCLVD